MRIAVCDDSRLSQVLFINALREWDPAMHAECFLRGADLLKAMREKSIFDIVFLDIYLPGENGVEIAAEIQKISPRTGLVFITNSQDHAVDAYSLNALHYLVKPITVDGLAESFQRLERFLARSRPTLTLNVGRDIHTMYLEAIVYISSAKHAKEIHLTNGQILRAWTEFQELEEKLDKSFVRLNKGVIVNMEHIRQLSQEYCILGDGTRLDISRRERPSVRAAYDEYLFTRLSGKQ